MAQAIKHQWARAFKIWIINFKRCIKNQYKNFGYAQGHRQAIVILGSGRRLGALDLPEYQHQDTSSTAMERVHLGDRLVKQAKLPILVAGGA